MAKIKIAGIKGMTDMLPEESAVWEFFTDTARRTASLYGFRQIRTPILEQTALFTRGIGEVTDIVEKEMYSFEDSMNGEKLTLRPENTSAVVRCAIEHSLTYNAPQRASNSIPWENSKSAPSTARRSLRTFSKTPIFWTKTQRDGFSQTP